MADRDLPPAGPCRSCRAEIRWAQTADKKTMPVNAAPSPSGNLALHELGGVLYANVVTRNKRDAMTAAGYPLYQSHFTDCPNANDWRTR